MKTDCHWKVDGLESNWAGKDRSGWYIDSIRSHLKVERPLWAYIIGPTSFTPRTVHINQWPSTLDLAIRLIRLDPSLSIQNSFYDGPKCGPSKIGLCWSVNSRSNIYIHFSKSTLFFVKSHFLLFLNQYRKKITHLKMSHLGAHPTIEVRQPIRSRHQKIIKTKIFKIPKREKWVIQMKKLVSLNNYGILNCSDMSGPPYRPRGPFCPS